MTRKYLLLIGFSIFILLAFSCKEDEGFHQISTIEREIYLKINSYRNSQGRSSLVEQFLIFKEGRIISEKMAAGDYSLGDTKAQADLEKVSNNLGGSSSSLLTMSSNIQNADSIVNYLTREPSSSDILKGNFTQCGVGFATNKDNLNYISVLLINIPE